MAWELVSGRQFFEPGGSLFLGPVLALRLNKQFVEQSLFTRSCHVRMLPLELDVFLEILAPMHIQSKIWQDSEFFDDS